MTVKKRQDAYRIDVAVGKLRTRHPAGTTKREASRVEAIARRDLQQLPPARSRRLARSLLNLARLGFAGMQRRIASADTMYPHLKAIEPYCEGKALRDIVAVADEIIADGKRQKLTSATINRRLCMLRNAAKAARRMKVTTLRYDRQIKSLPETGAASAVFLRPKQVGVIADAMDNQECQKAVLIAAYTGVPRGKLFKLTPKNRNARGDLSVPGRGDQKPRIVKVPSFIKPLLAELPIQCTDQQLRYAWEQATAKVGIEARFQDLHHTYAAWLIEQGADPESLQEKLGALSPLTVKRYAPIFAKAAKRRRTSQSSA